MTMYLSHLLIDVGANPDRPRPGRRWLRNVYRVHQRLCMAFPSKERKERDPEFLQPYVPGELGKPDVHEERTESSGFLFRIDPVRGGNPVILVQSANRPDWQYAFQNAQYLLAAPVDTLEKPIPQFIAGDRLRFRLKANPVRHACARSKHPSGAPVDPKWVGKRIPVLAESLGEWLLRHGERCGFEIVSLSTPIPGYVYFNKGRDEGQGQRLRSVLYEGVLSVKNPAPFAEAVQSGIGRAKAFGFGLLSLARISP
ncbi:MAG: type I-E CRISPR-associated protein Cas6/Cse3/CasE [Candidatus Brocadiia bacterium]